VVVDRESEPDWRSKNITDLAFDLEETLIRFAPEIRLHPDDPYRPSSVDWYLERTSVKRWRGLFRRDEGVLSEGQTTMDWLGSLSRFEDQSEIYLSILDGPDKNETRRGFQPISNQVSAPCYINARSAPDDSTASDLQYWFFYPFNGSGGRHIPHEGDWEHVTMRVTNTESPVLIAVYASAHGLKNGGWWPCEGGELLLNQLNNPVIYSALGSHASYISKGKHSQRWPKPVDQTSDLGPIWQTSQDLVLVAVNGQALDIDKKTYAQFSYRGRWGPIRKLSWPFRATGPVGPAEQKPWISEPPLSV